MGLNLKPIAFALSALAASPEDPDRMAAFLEACEPAIKVCIGKFGRNWPEDIKEDAAQVLRMRLASKAVEVAEGQESGRIAQGPHYIMTILKNAIYNFANQGHGGLNWEPPDVAYLPEGLAEGSPAPDPVARQELREKLAEAFEQVFSWIGRRWSDLSFEQRHALRVLDRVKAGKVPPMTSETPIGRRNAAIVAEVLEVLRCALNGDELPYCPVAPYVPTLGELADERRAEKRRAKEQEEQERTEQRQREREQKRRAEELARMERARQVQQERQRKREETARAKEVARQERKEERERRKLERSA
jgi:hypothetical protein